MKRDCIFMKFLIAYATDKGIKKQENQDSFLAVMAHTDVYKRQLRGTNGKWPAVLWKRHGDCNSCGSRKVAPKTHRPL